MIAERGHRGASLAAVAERVGLTQEGLLHHFPTKEALLVAVLRDRDRDRWDATPAGRLRLDLPASLVEYNAVRPAIIQTFSALLGESVTEGHPARAYFTERTPGSARPWPRCCAPSTASACRAASTPERAAPLLVTVLDGLQYQWLLDPESVTVSPSGTS
ncbi:transcriptional regulator [Streptomyces azureus]|uniref:Transcriptional regulator n=1 Tax=Streptomyces azureus TaxID=146537 RepID=A0A0K8PRQ1_STRAJ|nr:transcriptional regulator [Streptomyces azureus]